MTFETSTKIAFCSSLKDNVWHDVRGKGAFEGWHFDAISDDGDEVLLVEFYDNYVLSPRFYDAANHLERSSAKVPVVSLIYYARGQVVVGAVNEFAEDRIVSDAGDRIEIGESSIHLERKAYGTAIRACVDLATFGGRRIKADLEWLMIESDLVPLDDSDHAAVWNLTAPRADMTGTLELIGRSGRKRRCLDLNGTGFHDHILSRDVHYKDLRSRMWGRAHFSDATVVFERHGGVQDPGSAGRFFVVKDGEIFDFKAECYATEHKRDILGLNVPRRISYTADDGSAVSIKPYKAIRSDFCEVKMLGTVALTLADGKTRETTGLVEFVDPTRLRSGIIRRVSDLRIGRRGRSGLF